MLNGAKASKRLSPGRWSFRGSDCSIDSCDEKPGLGLINSLLGWILLGFMIKRM
ncbi:unnamed protein product, partial [Brassica oleracea]